jgi:hypothetical protein
LTGIVIAAVVVVVVGVKETEIGQRWLEKKIE